MPDLALGDITLHYETGGDGEPVVLLAGMLSDSASWAPILPLLEPYFRVIRPDNRTTGRTVPALAPVSVAQMAQDALALMDHLGHARFHIVGHSMGGLMGVELAGLAGARAQSLTILASARVRVPRTMAVFDMLMALRNTPEGEEMWLRALYPWIFRPAFFEDPQNADAALRAALDYPHAQSAKAMQHQIEALRSFRPETDPGDIRCPVQAIYAEHDLLIPEEAARSNFAAIPDLRQITVPDAGHSLHWDAPEAVAGHIIDFIRKD